MAKRRSDDNNRFNKPPPGYRKGVGIVLLNRDGLVFVAQRIDTPGEAWQMPQGGIDRDEAPRAAALRELKEEIGTDRAEVLAESRDWLAYDLPPKLGAKVWKGRYKGQCQKWFVLRFLGDDGDIDLDGDSPEFSAWRWVPAGQLPDMIVAFKRPLYRAILAEFAEILQPSSCT